MSHPLKTGFTVVASFAMLFDQATSDIDVIYDMKRCYLQEMVVIHGMADTVGTLNHTSSILV